MAKRRQSKKSSLDSWLIPRLRRISLYWPGKVRARLLAKRMIQTGVAKNGNPKMSAMYECAQCKILVNRKGGHMDHIVTVMDLDSADAAIDWNKYIPNLFAEATGYQHLCIPCHTAKTLAENKIRAIKRKEKNGKT